MKILDSLIYYIKMISGGICVFFTGLLCGIDPKNELIYRKACSRFLISLIAKEIIIKGELDKDVNILIGNHTHNLDIALMESVIKEKIIWIAKKELSQIPIIKYMVTKTGMILADRNNKASIIKMLKEIKKNIDNGYKITLFPEGTRNKTNPKKMLPWKKGTQAIIEKLNLKVQPFIIINLPFAFEKNKIKKQTIKVIFLESFYPYPNWFEDIQKKMQKLLDKEYNEN